MAEGAGTTIVLSLFGSGLALFVAFTMGVARLSSHILVRYPAIAFVEFFRGSSVFVQLFWVYYVMPLYGVRIDPITAAVLVLGANVGSYGSEIVRSSIRAVPREQYEACTALNLGRWAGFWFVILPQALRMMLPPFSNQAVELIKISAVVSLITVADATFQANLVRSVTGNTLVPYLLLRAFYYLLATCWVQAIRKLERRLARQSEGTA
jgi:polar amino acid transport system permease protein